MIRKIPAILPVILLALTVFTGASEAKRTTSSKVEPSKKSLFIRIGGSEGVSAITDQFVANCIGDPRVGSYFTSTISDASRLTSFKKNIAEQICSVTGGNCKYWGKPMKVGHAGMKITNEHFDAVVEDFSLALNQFRIGTEEKSALLKIIETLRSDIVQKKGS